MDIFNIDTVVHPSDKVYTNKNGISFLTRFNSKGNKNFLSQYENGKFNGRAEFYKDNGKTFMAGHMKNNKANGLWLYLDYNMNVDSAKVILDAIITPVEKLNFNYDTIKVMSGYDSFYIKKPRKWGTIVIDDRYNIGIVDSVFKNNEPKAKLVSFIDTFPSQNIDLKFAVNYILDKLEENIQINKILSEEYNSNNYSSYYFMELEGMKNNKKKLITLGLFIQKHTINSLLGISEYDNEIDYHVYKWIFKDVTNSFIKDSNRITER